MEEIIHIKKYSIENIKAVKSNNKDFDLFEFAYFSQDIEHLKKSHRHDFHAFIIISEGTGSHVIDFTEYTLQPNRVFFINYGQIHCWLELNDVKGYVVLFTNEFYNLIFTGNKSIKSDNTLLQNYAFIDIDNLEMDSWNQIITLIEKEFISDKINKNEIICLMLKSLVIRYKRQELFVLQNNVKSDRKLEVINQYKTYINQFYKEWKLPKLYAQVLNMTPNYLNAICNKILGVSATYLIKERVILEAKRFLTHSDLSVTQIAYELGFDDNSHFGKYFKSSTNCTPEGFRQYYLENK